jgi:hypothetical protein
VTQCGLRHTWDQSLIRFVVLFIILFNTISHTVWMICPPPTVHITVNKSGWCHSFFRVLLPELAVTASLPCVTVLHSEGR